ncbi:MAG: hypothetical protein E7511_03190 [Ruminococcus sp.]|nr:hypothetical protein [Ruminococcus sp.]
MRKERKEALLHSFPAVPNSIMEQMKGRGAKNYVVLLTNGNELFARCYHRYYDGQIIERQRYVFAKDGFCRYGYHDYKGWSVRNDFREPVFCSASYGYNFDNTYSVLNWDAIAGSDMRYSQADSFRGGLLMNYFRLYCKHPNLEYIIKAGYHCCLVEDTRGWWGGRVSLNLDASIDWKSNNLLKMLHLNRTEFKALQGQEDLYFAYLRWREQFPKLHPADLIALAKVFDLDSNLLKCFEEQTDKPVQRIARYLNEQDVNRYDYRDYLDQCEHLHYDLHDTAICFPHDFIAMHARLSAVIKYEHDQKALAEFAKRKSERIFLEWQSGDYLIRQPDSMDEIVAEGRALCHCVAGYADRHAKGALHILFIRDVSEPDKPLATLELSADGKLRQVHGYGNDVKKPLPQEVKDFVNEWLDYIRPYFEKKERKSA